MEPLPGRFDLVVSNPPYVAADDPHLGQGDLRFEPRDALCPGSDPLAAIREIARQAARRLNPGGWLLVEHGTDQGAGVRAVFERAGFRAVITSYSIHYTKLYDGRSRRVRRWSRQDAHAR